MKKIIFAIISSLILVSCNSGQSDNSKDNVETQNPSGNKDPQPNSNDDIKKKEEELKKREDDLKEKEKALSDKEKEQNVSTNVENSCDKFLGIWKTNGASLSVRKAGGAYLIKAVAKVDEYFSQQEDYTCTCENGVLKSGKGDIFVFDNGKIVIEGQVFTKQ
jgi:cobalamin biosynthesis protein CobT